jgi:hypothetical protein
MGHDPLRHQTGWRTAISSNSRAASKTEKKGPFSDELGKEKKESTSVNAHLSLLAGWLGVLGGVISGALIGLFFHRDNWVGGYSSFSRRMIRLGHISFFGIGFLNFALGLTASAIELPPDHLNLAIPAMITGAVTMPLLCFLTAWHTQFRHLFFIPVICVLVAALAVVSGWPTA